MKDTQRMISHSRFRDRRHHCLISEARERRGDVRECESIVMANASGQEEGTAEKKSRQQEVRGDLEARGQKNQVLRGEKEDVHGVTD